MGSFVSLVASLTNSMDTKVIPSTNKCNQPYTLQPSIAYIVMTSANLNVIHDIMITTLRT